MKPSYKSVGKQELIKVTQHWNLSLTQDDYQPVKSSEIAKKDTCGASNTQSSRPIKFRLL